MNDGLSEILGGLSREERAQWGDTSRFDELCSRSWPQKADFRRARSLYPEQGAAIDAAEIQLKENGRALAARAVLKDCERAVARLHLEWLVEAIDGDGVILDHATVRTLAALLEQPESELKALCLGDGELRRRPRIRDEELAHAQDLVLEQLGRSEHQAGRDALSGNDDDAMRELLAFVATNHRCPEPLEIPELDAWLRLQRRLGRQGVLAPERHAALEAIPGWRWYFPNNANVKLGFERLLAVQSLVRAAGTSLLPFETLLPDGFPVAYWFLDQRRNFHAGRIGDRTLAVLEVLPDWVWDHDRWVELVAIREMERSARQHGSVAAAMHAGGLSRRSLILLRKWWENPPETEIADLLEPIDGWSWCDPDDLCDLRATAEAHVRLHSVPRDPIDDAIARRLLGTSSLTLTQIGAPHRLSREAVRQREAKLLSKLAHPVLMAPTHKILEQVRATESEIDAAAADLTVVRALKALPAPAGPSLTYAAQLFSTLSGSPVTAAELTITYRPKLAPQLSSVVSAPLQISPVVSVPTLPRHVPPGLHVLSPALDHLLDLGPLMWSVLRRLNVGTVSELIALDSREIQGMRGVGVGRIQRLQELQAGAASFVESRPTGVPSSEK